MSQSCLYHPVVVNDVTADVVSASISQCSKRSVTALIDCLTKTNVTADTVSIAHEAMVKLDVNPKIVAMLHRKYGLGHVSTATYRDYLKMSDEEKSEVTRIALQREDTWEPVKTLYPTIKEFDLSNVVGHHIAIREDQAFCEWVVDNPLDWVKVADGHNVNFAERFVTPCINSRETSSANDVITDYFNVWVSLERDGARLQTTNFNRVLARNLVVHTSLDRSSIERLLAKFHEEQPQVEYDNVIVVGTCSCSHPTDLSQWSDCKVDVTDSVTGKRVTSETMVFRGILTYRVNTGWSKRHLVDGLGFSQLELDVC